ncbi:phosphoribosylamine--glycine ligase [Ferruginibacter paludis]|uniref:phosphoribosylamine--glycine ligase n=1 Tax=Ferruginibacter paludis TaxID=1310417 RepID=UPI0025B4A9AF|nr:phosphoribosylamine--glycine ligase [Ferruginibacter paludis]MDN3658445.1 phosphoribosylamine--glycine ligase [Ferruginibacter paludis]
MNILLVGGGGREHTLAWKINKSSLCDQLFIAPGNAGTPQFGINVPIAVTDFEGQATFCIANNITMLIVGPEEPLVKGIYDYFKNRPDTAHIEVIGPSKEAAQLEGSKAFAKAFMQRHNIPTAAYQEFDSNSYEAGIAYIRNHSLPIVLKADGLAAGKGVLICNNHIEALAEFQLMIQQSKFGEAGRRVVIEQFLDGIELSVFVLTDGINFVVLPEAKDYKKIGVGDTGPNTGGMGAVSPVPFADAAYMKTVTEKIIRPTIEGLQKEALDYKGFVFIGLINVKGEPFVIEYNCRLGDPETEVIIPRIENDLIAVLSATAQQRLNEIEIITSKQSAVTVMAVSGGYPNDHETGKVINGLDDTRLSNTMIFHAGTRLNGDQVVTSGGRVLAVTSFGNNLVEAAEQSNYMLEQIHFDGMYFREDIGFEFR